MVDLYLFSMFALFEGPALFLRWKSTRCGFFFSRNSRSTFVSMGFLLLSSMLLCDSLSSISSLERDFGVIGITQLMFECVSRQRLNKLWESFLVFEDCEKEEISERDY